MMQHTLRRLFVLAAVLLLCGCGQTLYYQNILLSRQNSEADMQQTLAAAADTLGYGSCGVGRAGDFCNNTTGRVFRVTRVTATAVEIEFEALGSVKADDPSRLQLANELQRRCVGCQVQIKNHSVQGLLKDDTGWMNMPKP